jgi:hypothetical protein
MYGGTITGNYGTNKGGGVYVGYGGEYFEDGTFTKSGGSISMNRSESGNGTQVYYNAIPAKYCNNDLGETDNISTDDLTTNWDT